MSEKLFEDHGMTSSDRRIHTPSAFARKNLNFVQETGRLKSLKAHSCVRENLDSFLFFLVISGAGTVATGGKVYEVGQGDCVFLDCRKHYEHKSSEENPWEIQWVHFNGKDIPGMYAIFLEGNKNSPVFHPAAGTALYQEQLQALNSKQESKFVMEEMESSHMLGGLVLQCLKDVVKNGELALDHAGEQLDTDECDNLRESVNEHIDEPGLLGTLAVQYGLKPERLNQIFEEKYGITLSDYILNRKFIKAKEMLRFTIKPIDVIAKESGLEEEETLRQLLREQEQLTPEEYRKKWAQWIKS